MDSVHVLYNDRLGVISKNIYGHFAEDAGAIIEGGVWVGENSGIPNIRGIRKSLVDRFRAINPPVIRWPGGCTAEIYDWRDGIGARDRRPAGLGIGYRFDGKVKSNEFGTHEFMDFCRLVGAEPYLCVNVASNPPLETFRWMEYCNMPRGMTALARLREKNGSAEPFNVRYWDIGNENGYHGGMMTPEDYCAAYSRIVSICFSILENREVIASGPIYDNVDWSRRFFASYNSRAAGWEGKQLDGYSLHLYSVMDGHDDTFTEEEWYQQLANAAKMQPLIEDHAQILREFDPARHVGLVIDEWGSWLSGKRVPTHGKPLYEQTGTMRDALVAAITLNIFNNHCDAVKMANISMLVNSIHSLFMTDAEKLLVTPTYYVYDMMKAHQDAECVRTVCASESIRGVQRVTASASVKEGHTLLTLVNASHSDPTDVVIELHGGAFPGKAVVTTLAAGDPRLHNTFGEPNAVRASRAQTDARGGRLRLVLPAASVVGVGFSGAGELAGS